MTISGSANITLGADTLVATASSRFNLGIHHLFAACKATKRIGRVEQENIGQPFGDFWHSILHDSLVVATSSAACLESYANELYFEANFVGHGLSTAASDELGRLVDREPSLGKFSTALAFRCGKPLDRGSLVVQNVESLINLRNALIHYRSEWFGQPGDHAKLSSRLAGKFAPSTFLSSEPIFPRAWASHSFAQWAIESTYGFLVFFYDQAGDPSPMKDYREQIAELSGCER